MSNVIFNGMTGLPSFNLQKKKKKNIPEGVKNQANVSKIVYYSKEKSCKYLLQGIIITEKKKL